ncbi:MAG TPA: bacillithiol biosynthesis cysteine-adding enzyme BshC [Bacteroidetes bacterium]|nr:bacillithiol biosynthesis cysteine-adding enzyme BshC [Bacteroidota bacterium]
MSTEARPVPHGALGASRLFQAVAGREPEALAFYAHDWRDGLAEAARIAAEHPRDRDALADALVQQNRRWGADAAAMANAETLRQPEAVAVLTGQQLGLFGGPLYTVWKALGAVLTARRVARETGRPAVPVFWLAGEDHDLDEVRQTLVPRGESVAAVGYGASDADNRQPVGRIDLDAEALADALGAMEAALPEGPHRADVVALLRRTWSPGRPWRDAFAETILALTRETGLVLVSPDDPAIKTLARDLFAAEATDWEATFEALTAQTERLRSAGFHAQIEPAPLNLFLLDGDDRLALDPGASGVRVRQTGARVDLAETARQRPGALSPNVVLRPVMQDALFPTVAYVAGPGETAYFAQLRGVYERFGVPMPAIVPRLSVTLVPASVRKVLDRYGLALPDLREGIQAHWKRLAMEASDTDFAAAFADARAATDAEIDRLAPLATGIDTSLEAAAEAARTHIHAALARLETKTVRVQKRRHDDVRARLARAHAALWPNGTLQERAANPFAFAVALGLDGFAWLADALGEDIDTSRHWVVEA